MSQTWGDRIFDWINKSVLFFVMIVVLYPIIFVVSASISDPQFVNNGTMWLWPKGITFEGYQRVLDNVEIWTGYRNTILYTIFGTSLNLMLTIPCAYALSRKDLVGRNGITGIILVTMFINGGLIPTYLVVKGLHLLNTPLVMIILGGVNVWNLIVARTFFQSTVPRELEEAAEVDGCSNLRLFMSVVVPISGPIIAVMALFYGVAHWNQYFNALMYLQNRELFPLQLVLREILIVNEMSSNMMMDGDSMLAMAEQAKVADMIKYAIIIISALPLLVVFPFVQRFFIKGVLIGSLKG
ncbi:carbohydrate ABC transporter permease [Paenibacillus chungangensis]|uniref:Carbohydrate ABC transporter permease n=1 Tax=Paenibacillus chungangensis TaxID=696535 RepID=A0ABW3HKL9_9BACL